ncbi:MAG: hypothetical protein H0U55_13410, partial [Rubrobacteraceae bacterium]|nr:hypothetical protein [Rubrobacteraceae bacterium]
APSFDDDEDITPDYEDRIRSYFGLESLDTSGAGYGAYSETRSSDEHSDQETLDYDAGDDTKEYEDSSTVDSGEREEPAAEGEPSWNVPEYGGSGEAAGRDDRIDAGEPPERESSLSGTTGSPAEEPSGEAPTTRQTEETETFREGGRTKIRRRVIREEIYEEDDPNAGS